MHLLVVFDFEPKKCFWVWTDQSNSAATQDEAEDEAGVCVLCCQKRSTVAVCDECKEH